MKKNKENNYILLLKELISVFVSDINLVSIKLLDSNDYDYNILVLISDTDMKELVGYKGNNVNSIKNILKSYAYKNNEKIKIEFESF